MLPEELAAVMAEMGEKPYRAGQIFAWLNRGVRSFDEMTNLSKHFREKLSRAFFITSPKVASRQESQLDGTIKFLWAMGDGSMIESVVMRYRYGNTVCISSQVGCRMGCRFCASTLGGLTRNLTPAELLDQVLFSQNEAGLKISNIVLMGIGEPLDNFENVMQFLKLVSHPDGLGIGMRRITLSTCGLTEIIDKMGSYGLQLTLSVSLHAPDDATRSRLMPVNRISGIGPLMEACGRYFKSTGRRVSFEYAMIDGVNDTPAHAARLAALVKPAGGHVNLIPLNPVEERGLRPSEKETVSNFAEVLRQSGVGVTVRRRLGRDIDAACGQLRQKRAEAPLIGGEA